MREEHANGRKRLAFLPLRAVGGDLSTSLRRLCTALTAGGPEGGDGAAEGADDAPLFSASLRAVGDDLSTSRHRVCAALIGGGPSAGRI